MEQDLTYFYYNTFSDNVSGLKEKLLTIQIPTYNRCDELLLLLDCLKKEIHIFRDEVEILISNNSSNDKTHEKCIQFINENQQLNIHLYTQKENLGPAGNIIFLVEKARSRYIWNLGDDDIVVSEKLKKIIDFLKGREPEILLLRTDGIQEWSTIPKLEDCEEKFYYKKTYDSGVDELLFTACFLGSLVLERKLWLSSLDEVNELRSIDENNYPHWHATLSSFNKVGRIFVYDDTCVLGNFNMRGESKIPTFKILIFGRAQIWRHFCDSPVFSILKSKIVNLYVVGWKNIILGNANDVNSFRDLLKFATFTANNLKFENLRVYIYVILSLLFPSPRLWRYILSIKNKD